MALDKDLTADAERHSNALKWKTTPARDSVQAKVESISSTGQQQCDQQVAVKTAVIQPAANCQQQGVVTNSAAVTLSSGQQRSLSGSMDPSGQFRVPMRRGSPGGEHADVNGIRSRISHRSGLQRRDLATPPGLIMRSTSSHTLPTGVTSPAFSDVSLLRLTPGNGDERDVRGSSRDSCRWPHYRALPPIWGASDAQDNNGKDYQPPPSAGSLAETEILASQFTSPRHSAHVRRKRPLSISPFSLEVDLNQLIRTSPSSLVAYINGSRTSSVSSGSYGHLAAGKSSPAFNFPGAPPQLLRETSPPVYPPSERSTSPPPLMMAPTEEAEREEDKQTEMNMEPGEEETDVNRESEVDGNGAKEEDAGEDDGKEADANCHWKECEQTFERREDLVLHVNNEHIHGEKRDFICHWRGCCRMQKPFKAQYMLVVHMRRHTGEKPHKCSFEGCPKAYSRLENLKTHLRSHTGEKPYMCEFPGCTKAFTNASDRAKHQNRTHSNLKPYVCKNSGCPKRYTDPSSLRKHMKSCQLGVKKARGEDSKDTSTGVQTFPPTAQQAVKPSTTGKDGSSEAVIIQKVQQMEQSPTYIHHHSAQSPEMSDMGYGVYESRRYSDASQLSTGSTVLEELGAGYPGSRRGSNLSQASGCSYASQGHTAVLSSDPNVVAVRRGSGDVSPAGLPLNTLPSGYAMNQQGQQQLNRASPRQGQHLFSPLVQDFPGPQQETDYLVADFVSPHPCSQPSSRRSSLTSCPYPPAPDSGIGCFDYGSRRSSNSSVSGGHVSVQSLFHPSSTQLHQPHPPNISYGTQRPVSRGRALHTFAEPKVSADQPQLLMQQRRASDGNLMSPVYHPADFNNSRRASDPLHHLPQSHMGQAPSRGHLRNRLTPTQPLPLPPSMTRFHPQLQVTGYAHAPSPMPMVVDDSQATYNAMMPGMISTPLHHGMPPLSKYKQAFANSHNMVQQDMVVEDVQMDVYHTPTHAGHASVMPEYNGYMHCGAVPNMGVHDMTSSLSSYRNEHQQWVHTSAEEPLSVFT